METSRVEGNFYIKYFKEKLHLSKKSENVTLGRVVLKDLLEGSIYIIIHLKKLFDNYMNIMCERMVRINIR